MLPWLALTSRRAIAQCQQLCSESLHSLASVERTLRAHLEQQLSSPIDGVCDRLLGDRQALEGQGKQLAVEHCVHLQVETQ